MYNKILFENSFYQVRVASEMALGDNYEVVNTMTNLVEADFKALPVAIEAAMVLEQKLAACGFALDDYSPNSGQKH
jgi:hypothetical protein